MDATESHPISGKSKVVVDDGGSSFSGSGGTTSTWSDFKEVDYVTNPTELYKKVCNEDWEGALTAIEENPLESRTWVVHGDPCKNLIEEGEDDDIYDQSVRYLPLHASCERRPPLALVAALLTSYPEGISMVDMNGMFALHYACANQASLDVIELLLVRNQEANRMPANVHDGALPVHLAAQFGVSSPEVMRALLLVDNDLVCATDNDGCTPLDLAMTSKDYKGRHAVIAILRKALKKEREVHRMRNQDDLITSDHLSRFQQMKERRVQNSPASSVKKSDEIRDTIPSIISKNFSAIQQLNNGRDVDNANASLSDTECSLDLTPVSQKPDRTKEIMAEIDVIREKLSLEAAKTLHRKGASDQIKQEGKTVNMTGGGMESQVREVRSKFPRNSENRPWRRRSTESSGTSCEDLHVGKGRCDVI